MLRGVLPACYPSRAASPRVASVPISEQAAVDLYAEVCAADCVDLVDYEMSNGAASMKTVRDVRLARHRPGAHTIISRARRRCRNLAEFERARTMDGDVAKVSVMARSPDDAFVLLAATRQASQAMAARDRHLHGAAGCGEPHHRLRLRSALTSALPQRVPRLADAGGRSARGDRADPGGARWLNRFAAA
jgi:hypothetical protein